MKERGCVMPSIRRNPRGLVTTGPSTVTCGTRFTSYLIFWSGWAIATASPWSTVSVATIIVILVTAARREEKLFSEIADGRRISFQRKRIPAPAYQPDIILQLRPLSRSQNAPHSHLYESQVQLDGRQDVRRNPCLRHAFPSSNDLAPTAPKATSGPAHRRRCPQRHGAEARATPTFTVPLRSLSSLT